MIEIVRFLGNIALVLIAVEIFSGLCLSLFLLIGFRKFLKEEREHDHFVRQAFQTMAGGRTEEINPEIVEKLSLIPWEQLQELCKVVECCPHRFRDLFRHIEGAMLVKTIKGEKEKEQKNKGVYQKG